MAKTSVYKRDYQQKEMPLEAIRGLAAIIVVFWHCCVGFLPTHTGVFPQYANSTWQGSPLFFLINGPSAVFLFFVLSGYVLTRNYFISGNTAGPLKSAIKRWPRLAGPVLVTVLVSYAFFKFGFYAFVAAGNASGSPWLVNFAYAYPPGTPPPSIGFWDALKQGTLFVFFRGDDYYDSSLWTMQPEFFGSFIAFGMAPLLFEAKKQKRAAWCVFSIVGCVALMTYFKDSTLMAFPVGVALAASLPREKTTTQFTASGALVLALFFLGYSGRDIGAYKLFAYLPFQGSNYKFVSILGAAIIIYVVETFPPMKRFFSGNFSRWLGEFSFPMYLLHVLLICSVGSRIFLHYGTASAILSVVCTTPLLAFPLLLFNRKWIILVNRAATFFVSTSV